MPVTSLPHSSWADVYDLVYEHTFGNFYDQLTDTTIDVIADRISPPAKIVDFGAGTGRLFIPLARKGYDVVAVEPCMEMLTRLKQKREDLAVASICSKMEEFMINEEFDFALCVFTVILYLLTEESLKKAMLNAYTSLKPGGRLLIDIPAKAIFHGYSNHDNNIKRSVSVSPEKGDIFTYHESIEIKDNNGEDRIYNDEFLIRYWPEKKVLAVLNEVGFIFEEDLSSYFAGAGASYYIMKKAEHLEGPRLSSDKRRR